MRILFTLLLFVIAQSFSGSLSAQGRFVKGADVGFLQGQERRGVVFHDRNGRERECACLSYAESRLNSTEGQLRHIEAYHAAKADAAKA